VGVVITDMGIAGADMPLKIGTVSYLNSVPLNEGLYDHPDVDLHQYVPSRLARELADGSVDIGLVPVVEALRHGRYRIFPDAAIGCVGEVLSVKVFSDVPLADIRSVRLDPSSRTSNALTQVILEGAYSLSPRYVDASNPDPTDAAVIIGDPVLRRTEAAHAEIDLGQAWFDMTGLPFVFAVWAGRPDVATERAAEILAGSKRAGVRNIDSIATREAASRDLNAELCRRYLRDYICFDLGEAQQAGIRWFATLAAERGLLPGGAPDVDSMFL
jgi:chorismate dehydratase